MLAKLNCLAMLISFIVTSASNHDLDMLFEEKNGNEWFDMNNDKLMWIKYDYY